MRITKIVRAVYLTEIRTLPSLNCQKHSQINQRPIVQGLLNISMLILRTPTHDPAFQSSDFQLLE